MGKREDLTGKRFGMLTVTSFDRTHRTPSGQWRAYWHASCDCGGQKSVSAESLRRGRCISCGCQERAPGRSKAYPGHPTWLSQVWQEYKTGARNRSLSCELTIEQVGELCKSDCHYCGAPPAPRHSTLVWGGMVVNGIDRRDSTVGYTIANCVPCCSTCNRMKMALPVDTFIAQVKRIAEHDPK
jgi:hypothetical protein